MQRTTRGGLRLMLGAVAALAAGPALADYPDKPIQYILGHAAGGGSDVGTRTWVPYMEKCLGGTVVVNIMPGGGGALGFAAIASADPDGYTLGQLTTPGHVTVSFGKEMPFSMDSFEYLGNFYGVGSVIAVNKAGKLKSFQEVVDFAKASSTPINVGVGSIGNDDHLAGLQFMAESGLNFNLIPFGDNSQTRNALMGGHVDIAMMSNTEIVRFQDELMPLAIAARERKANLPEVPTFQELGYNVVAGTTMPLAAPKGTPAEVLDKWKACIAEISQNKEFIAEAEKRGMSPMLMDAQATFNHVKSQRDEYQKLYDAHPWGN